jgi:ubiquinone/menaquinone biosynthesis C-methylase UbiE
MIAELNLELFGDIHIVDEYASKTGLVFGEPTVFRDLGPLMKGKSILDIGVGAGRTTTYLLECQPSRYVGVDFADNMVEKCRRRFPGVDFRSADARSLTDFSADEFDFVMFSWSGIDCVSHEDRLRVLSEVRRILVPGGVFVFSSANARRISGPPWSREAMADLDLKWSVRGVARAARDFTRGVKNYLLHRREQVFTKDYVINLDAAHSFRLLRYNIAPDKQAAQLQASGFGRVRSIDKQGSYRDFNDESLVDTPIYYICEKSA